MDRNDLLFWTDILSDHAMFQANALSYKEAKFIAEAERFHYLFKSSNESIQQGQNVDMHILENNTSRFIDFKKKIIINLLNHNILINFSPSFVNHMVNEANEFLGLFHAPSRPQKTEPSLNSSITSVSGPSAGHSPASYPLYIKIWLADASGHASALASFLDLAETPSIQQGEYFKFAFDNLGKKASEISMIAENLKEDVSVELLKNVELLKEETINTLEEFIKYCEKTGELLDKKTIMGIGTFSSIVTNHFIKEHRYFIDKVTRI